MKKYGTIGIMIPQETYLFSNWSCNYYFMEILRGAIASAELFQWDILVQRVSEYFPWFKYADIAENKKIDGVLIVAPVLSGKNITEIKHMGIPSVVVNGRYEGLNYVDTDNENGAIRAVEYLISLGHRRIAFINGKEFTSNAKERYGGYVKALGNNGMELNEEYIKSGDFSQDSGYVKMKELLETKYKYNRNPTSVFCANDLMAIGAMKAIEEKGLKIPDDISLIGFDDIIISGYLCPPLTTIRQQLFHLGKEAVNTIINIIKEDIRGIQKMEIKTRLIERGSVSAPAKARKKSR
ncbi:MAG: substrate-binding domain-containing protein [Elusimicrobia bacterium]|nr:substrate-binding domain-containing protein [Elusimicrobiota bacterium]